MFRCVIRGLVALAALLLAAPVAVLVASPAHACSCAMGQLSDYAEWADVVFTGTVEQDSVSGGSDRSMEPVEFAVDVTAAFKGDVARRAEVQTASNSAACGLDQLPGEGEEWIWFASTGEPGRPGAGGEVLVTGLCSGSGPVSASSVSELTELLGEPNPATPAVATAQEAPADDGVRQARPGTDDGPDRMPWALAGLAVVAFAAAGGWRLRHRPS